MREGMNAGDPVVVRSVDLLKPSGERVAVRMELGPMMQEGRDVSCGVRFHGWIDCPPDVRGRDSLEAMLLAVGLVHGILAEFVRRGGRILWAGTSNDCDLVEFVSSPEWDANLWRRQDQEPGKKDRR